MKKICFIMALACALACASCGKRQKDAGAGGDTVAHIDTTRVMVMQIQKCSRLYTTEYRIHKVITHDDQLSVKGKLLNHDYDIALPLGKRKVAIPIDATAKAYIDFGGFGEANVRRDSSHIEIVLPQPHIVLTSSRIDHAHIREYVALTRRNFSDSELAAFEQQGRKAVIDDIAGTDILENARIGAANVLIPMIEQMGYRQENITITFDRDYTTHDIIRLVEPGGKNPK